MIGSQCYVVSGLGHLSGVTACTALRFSARFDRWIHPAVGNRYNEECPQSGAIMDMFDPSPGHGHTLGCFCWSCLPAKSKCATRSFLPGVGHPASYALAAYIATRFWYRKCGPATSCNYTCWNEQTAICSYCSWPFPSVVSIKHCLGGEVQLHELRNQQRASVQSRPTV